MQHAFLVVLVLPQVCCMLSGLCCGCVPSAVCIIMGVVCCTVVPNTAWMPFEVNPDIKQQAGQKQTVGDCTQDVGPRCQWLAKSFTVTPLVCHTTGVLGFVLAFQCSLQDKTLEPHYWQTVFPNTTSSSSSSGQSAVPLANSNLLCLICSSSWPALAQRIHCLAAVGQGSQSPTAART